MERRHFLLSSAALLGGLASGHAASCEPRRLSAMIGDYPNTRALKRGTLASDCLGFDFASVRAPADAFARVAALEFDVAELSVVTFLIAKSLGIPLVLLPAVMFARLQHPFIVCDSSRGVLAPKDLEGRRVGVAYYTTTTSTWLRGVLAEDYGVDVTKIRWIARQGPHIAAFRDPPNVERVSTDKSLVRMLTDGDVDSIVIAPVPVDPRFVSIIPDARGAGLAWHRRTNAIHLNHMVVVKQELSRTRPDLVRETYRLLAAARAAGEPVTEDGVDLIPYGLEANRHNLEVAIANIHRQGIIPRAFAVDELFDDVTASLTG